MSGEIVKNLQNCSIKSKLTLMGMSIALFTALIICIPFIAYYIHSEKQSLINELSHTGDLIGDVTAPALQLANNLPSGDNSSLQFQADTEQTEKHLMRSLSRKTSIILACLYTNQNTIYAKYRNTSTSLSCPQKIPEMQTHLFSDKKLFVYRAISSKRERIVGGIYLVSDMSELNQHLRLFIGGSVMFMIGVLIAAYLVVKRVQRIISNPIDQLTIAAHSIKDEHNYNTKVEKIFNDDLGLLVDAFNSMILEIKKRDKKLKEANDHLEDKVKERTNRLELAMADLKEALQAKTDFLSNMNHEIRTPIHGVRNFLRYLVDDWEELEQEERTEMVNKAFEKSIRLHDLINNLLDLSKFEEKNMEFDIKDNDMRDALDQIVRETEALCKDKDITVKIEDETRGETSACFDRGRINQVISNLFGNAIKFTAKDSTITICLAKDVLIEEKSENKLEGLRFSISDEGIGIPDDELSFIFEKFAESKFTKSQAGGTGLGLALCKPIILAHNGKIWAENNPDKGATFSFVIPCICSTNLNVTKNT